MASAEIVSNLKLITSGNVPTTSKLANGELAFGLVGGVAKMYGNVNGVIVDFSNFLRTAPVTSVAGKTGAVTLAKSDVGLGNVDNVKQYSANNLPIIIKDSGDGRKVGLNYSADEVQTATWIAAWNTTNPVAGAAVELRGITPKKIVELGGGGGVTQLVFAGTGNIELNGNPVFGWRHPLLVMSMSDGQTDIGFSSGTSGTPGALCNSAIVKKMPNGYWSIVGFAGYGIAIKTIAALTCYVRPVNTDIRIEIYSLK